MSTLTYCESTAFVVNRGPVRARFEEIVHCDACGGLIAGPSDYDVALCYCAKPKSGGKALQSGKLARARRQRDDTPEQPDRLDGPIATLAWDALPPHDK